MQAHHLDAAELVDASAGSIDLVEDASSARWRMRGGPVLQALFRLVVPARAMVTQRAM